jgi:hypothetical protein
LPLTPLALRIPAAVLRLCCVRTVRLGSAFELLFDDPVELFELLDEEFVDEVEEVEELDAPEEPAAGAVGAKVLFLTPKPMTAASVPLPKIVIVSFSFRLVITS